MQVNGHQTEHGAVAEFSSSTSAGDGQLEYWALIPSRWSARDMQCPLVCGAGAADGGESAPVRCRCCM